MLQLQCQCHRDGARLFCAQAERQAGRACGSPCIRECRSAAGPADIAAVGTASRGGSGTFRRGCAAAALRGRAAAARRPSSGTAMTRGGRLTLPGPATSASGSTAGVTYGHSATAECCSAPAAAAGLPGWAGVTAASSRQGGRRGPGPAGTYQCWCVTGRASLEFISMCLETLLVAKSWSA